MKIEKVISPRGCLNGACPTLRLTNTGLVILQGSKLASRLRTSLKVPRHEDLVGIPKAVFDDLLSQYPR
ncbi:MAG TPA: hypothetical protein P5186_18260 [Candidatus Paceibacterota bacterium]|nr:hypothetical protein [Verrucomicrobiota bacterium]HRY49999.1 hypothetical protein [Candidatus Paceibacterota bacterium]HRZ57660.1 hypothetical protein [Candidatus Paceibacterota bacterium]